MKGLNLIIGLLKFLSRKPDKLSSILGFASKLLKLVSKLCLKTDL